MLGNIFYNLHEAETNDELQELAQEISPRLTAYGNDIMLNADLFKKVEYVFNHQSEENLTTEQKTLLEKTYKGFVRNGSKLSDEAKEGKNAFLEKRKPDFSKFPKFP